MQLKIISLSLLLFFVFSFNKNVYGRPLRSHIESLPAKGNEVYNAVVDINGTGDYVSVQDAINAAPAGRTSPWLIFVKSGDYNEVVVVPKEKAFIHLIGQDKNNTIIHYKLNVQAQPVEGFKSYQNDMAAWKFSIHNSQSKVYNFPGEVVTINAADFYAENISFVNDWGVEKQNGPQSLAMSTQADRIAFYNCRFRSFQDTWMTAMKGINDRLYVSDCWIEGAVDYFYGGGNAYVEKTTLYNVRSGSVIVAPSQEEGTKYGYVFDHCIVDGNAAAADGRLKLGRPWHNRPVAVYLNTTMKIIPSPEGWTDMGPAAKMFAEYNSRNAHGKLINLSKRRTWYKQSEREGGQRVEGLTAQLTEQDAAKYTYKNIIEDGDGWDPRNFFQHTLKPVVRFSSGILTWNTIENASGYIIYEDNEVVGFTSAHSFTIAKNDMGNYSIQSVNKFGSPGGRSEVLTVK